MSTLSAIFSCNRNSPGGPGAAAGAPAVGGTSSGGGASAGAAGASCGQPSRPEVLYGARPGQPRRGLDVDAQDIFWCEVTLEEGLVVRAAAKNGAGPVRTLGSWYDFASVPTIVLDETFVYWLRPDGTGELVRVDKGGGKTVRVALPAGDDGRALPLGPLHNTADAIVAATQGCTHVLRIPKATGSPSLWRLSTDTPGGGVTALETDGNVVYCFTLQKIHRLDTATGQASVLTSGFSAGGALLRVDQQLFVGNNNTSAGASGTLAVVDPAAGSTRALGETYGQLSRLLYDDRRRSLHWVTGLGMVASRVPWKLDRRSSRKLVSSIGNQAAGFKALLVT